MGNYDEQLMTLCKDAEALYGQIMRHAQEAERLREISESAQLTDAASAARTAHSYIAMALSKESQALYEERGKS